MNKPFFVDDLQPKEPDAFVRWLGRGHNVWWAVALLWLECAIVMLAYNWSRFAGLDFNDPDDAMRLVQVRDFLAGQSWFDVSQHRINPPTGGPMHWSRLVDLPIASIIVALRPLLGQAMAEVVACVTVPLVTLAAICFSLYAALRRFWGDIRALLTVALLVTSFPILVQMTPLRIDHHAWQILMAAIMLGGVIAVDPRRGGIIAGLAAAMWLHISSEGLPQAAVAGAVIGARYVWREDEWPRLMGYSAALALGTIALALGVRGWEATSEFRCDGMTIAYIPEFLLLMTAIFVGHGIFGGATLARRIAVPATAALAAAALYATASRPCLSGPFYYLDPMVYDFWYKAILEGLPFWKQDNLTAAIILVPGIAGVAGLVAATIVEWKTERRHIWLTILGLTVPSVILSALMLRTMSVAHLYALIGSAWIIAFLYSYVAAQRQMVIRALSTAGLCLLAPVSLAVIATAAFPPAEEKAAVKEARANCSATAEIEGLRNLPAGSTLFGAIDLGPDILLRTQLNVIATSHHRNAEGLTKVIHAFMGSPDEARNYVISTQATHLIFCPALNEIQRYRQMSPKGFAAQMLDNKVPTWLKREHVPGVKAIQVYRIVR